MLAGVLVLAFPPAPPTAREIERQARALGMVYREEVLPLAGEGVAGTDAGAGKREVEIYIRPGSTSTEVAALLAAAGIVEEADDFERLVHEMGASRKLAAGRHRIAVPIDPQRLVEQLTRQ